MQRCSTFALEVLGASSVVLHRLEAEGSIVPLVSEESTVVLHHLEAEGSIVPLVSEASMEQSHRLAPVDSTAVQSM